MTSEQIPLGPDVRLLASHPAGLIAVEKPAGLRSQPNSSRADSRALLPLPYDSAQECFVDGPQRWFLLHRLDAPTSGVILLADNAECAAALRQLFAERKVNKSYAAIVRGKPRRPRETWQDQLRTERRGSAVRAERGGPARALSEMKAVFTPASPPLRTQLELHPKTGRTHQLRIQCASRRLAIIGDATYGDFRFNREFARRYGLNRLFLHARKLDFRLSFEGREIHFCAESPLPDDFRRALRVP